MSIGADKIVLAALKICVLLNHCHCHLGHSLSAVVTALHVGQSVASGSASAAVVSVSVVICFSWVFCSVDASSQAQGKVHLLQRWLLPKIH